MTLVSSSDVWLFISSTGGLTAGRVDAENALFPYYTDDKVAESAGRTGGLTILRVGKSGTHWQLFGEVRPGDPEVERTLYKDVLGTTLVFEEVRPDLGLRFRVTWETSARHGVVRSCELTAVGDQPCEAELVDGLVNLLPAGTSQQVQNELSNLLDAYKRSELDARHRPRDLPPQRLPHRPRRAERVPPGERGVAGGPHRRHPPPLHPQVAAFTRGDAVTEETEVRGERGAYLLRTRLSSPPARPGPGASPRTWTTTRPTSSPSSPTP